jgi:hypothetical protein
MGFFSVSKKKYRAKCSQMSTAELRREEALCHRNRISSGWGTWFGLSAMASAGNIFTAPLAIFPAIMRQKANKKLDLVQQETRSRGLQPTGARGRDKALGFVSAYGAQAVGPALEYVAGAESVSAGVKMVEAIPSEAATKGFLKAASRV